MVQRPLQPGEFLRKARHAAGGRSFPQERGRVHLHGDAALCNGKLRKVLQKATHPMPPKKAEMVSLEMVAPGLLLFNMSHSPHPFASQRRRWCHLI